MTSARCAATLCCVVVAACAGDRARPATRLELAPAPAAAHDAVEGGEPSRKLPSLEAECDSVVDLVNATVDKIERFTRARGSEADAIANMRKIEEAWASVAEELRRLDISNRSLRDNRRLYMSMARRAAAHARKVTAALESRDAATGKDAQKELDEVVSEEDEVVNQLNELCQRAE